MNDVSTRCPIVSQNVHAECLSQLDDSGSDGSCSYHTDGLAFQLESHQTVFRAACSGRFVAR